MNQSSDKVRDMIHERSYKCEGSEHDSAANSPHDISPPLSHSIFCHKAISSPNKYNSDMTKTSFLQEYPPPKQVSLSTTDSVTGTDGMSISFDEENVAFRCQEEWSFHQGEYSRYQIESGLISREVQIHQPIEEISTMSNKSYGNKEFSAYDSEEDIWDATFDRIQNYGRSCGRLQNHQRKLMMLPCIESICS